MYKKSTKRIFTAVMGVMLCMLFGVTVFATPMINAPFNPFDPVDMPPTTTAPATTPEPTAPETNSPIQTITTTEPSTTTAVPTTAAAPIPLIIPVNVREVYENGVRKIVKTYELSGKEKPENISRVGFTSDGWEYVFADMTKKETSETKTREFTQTIQLIPDTVDVHAITGVLDETKNYTSSDGYSGTLRLVESSVKAEVAGTKTVAFTLSETRTYSNLSHNDTSLIPKSISDKHGKTLTFSSVKWQTYNYAYVDGDSLADSYTAVVTYTGTGYKTVVTGYTGSAEYSGIISKSIPGKTVYTVYFVGTEIPPPTTTEPPTEPPTTTEAPTTTEELTTEEITEEPEPEPFNPVPAVAGTTSGAGLLGGVVFFFFLRRNVKVFNLKDGKYAPIGKTRVTYKNPIVNLTPFTNKAATGSFILVFDSLSTRRLSGKTVTINYGDKSFQHIIDSNGGEYQFEIDF